METGAGSFCCCFDCGGRGNGWGSGVRVSVEALRLQPLSPFM